MSKFRTYYEGQHLHVSDPGERMQPEYALEITRDGEKVLKKTGETDLQAYIQSHAESVEINNIINRYMNGESDALAKVQGFYADVSEMPNNLHDILNLNLKGEQIFDSLPAEVKEQYNNSYLQFLANPNIEVKNEKSDTEIKKEDDVTPQPKEEGAE